MKFRSKVGLRSTNNADAGWGCVAEAILRACAAPQPQALCVTGPERSGRLFIESQHVVHAEYGKEVGLSALVEMLRAGRVRLGVWNGAWPSRRTLRLGPLALLAKSAVPGAPPPLPAETEGRVRAEPKLSRAAAPDAVDQDERTRLWSRSDQAQNRLVAESSAAANDLRPSGVFCRNAAGLHPEMAPLPGSESEAAPTAEHNQASRLPTALVTGALTELGLADLLQILQWLRRSAVIRITRDDVDSQIWCESGEIIDAESGRLRGEAAVYRTLGFEDGWLIAELRSSHRTRTIFAPTHRFVLEAARRKDVEAPLRQVLGDEQQKLRFAGKSVAPELRPEELKLLRSFTAARTAHDAVRESELGDFETLKLLARWIQTGDLVPVGSGARRE